MLTEKLAKYDRGLLFCRTLCIVHLVIQDTVLVDCLCCSVGRGGKRKLTSVEDSMNAEVTESSSKNEGKVAETKRPKRQAAALDKVKVIVALDGL